MSMSYNDDSQKFFMFIYLYIYAFTHNMSMLMVMNYKIYVYENILINFITKVLQFIL